MAGTKIRLKVIKADGSVEEYFHTKVLGSISNALGAAGEADIGAAAELAEAVTYYLYHEKQSRSVTAGEIFSVVKAVLTATGYEEAAFALSEHHYERRLSRSRVEVASVDVEQPADAALCGRLGGGGRRSRWDKSRIVDGLMRQDVSRQTARMIAAMVEEKVFAMGLTVVTTELLKHVVLADSAAVLDAERQLQSV